MNLPRVRLSLVVLALGCVLPLAAMAALLLHSYYETAQRELTRNALDRTRAVALAVDRAFANVQASLQALATSPLLMDGRLGEFHAQARGALANMGAENIVLLDQSGQLLLTTRRAFGEPLPKLDLPPLLKRTFETGKPGISDLFVGPVVGQPIFTMAVPVAQRGAIVYSLNATFTPAQLAGLVREQQLPPSWRLEIIDSTGSVVTRTHDQEKFLGTRAAPDLWQHMGAASEGTFEGRALDNIPVLAAYSRSRSSQWTTALGVPLAEVSSELRQTLAWLGLACIAAIALGVALAWFIGGRIARALPHQPYSGMPAAGAR